MPILTTPSNLDKINSEFEKCFTRAIETLNKNPDDLNGAISRLFNSSELPQEEEKIALERGIEYEEQNVKALTEEIFRTAYTQLFDDNGEIKNQALREEFEQAISAAKIEAEQAKNQLWGAGVQAIVALCNDETNLNPISRDARCLIDTVNKQRINMSPQEAFNQINSVISDSAQDEAYQDRIAVFREEENPLNEESDYAPPQSPFSKFVETFNSMVAALGQLFDQLVHAFVSLFQGPKQTPANKEPLLSDTSPRVSTTSDSPPPGVDSHQVVRDTLKGIMPTQAEVANELKNVEQFSLRPPRQDDPPTANSQLRENAHAQSRDESQQVLTPAKNGSMPPGVDTGDPEEPMTPTP